MEYRPLTIANWQDFEMLLGPRGAYGGCWCMWWRLNRKVFEQQQGEGNHRAMRATVDAGRIPGILDTGTAGRWPGARLRPGRTSPL
jgi:hypothetical protein